MQYKNLSYSDDRDSSEKNIFNYDDVLNNNFMIVGGFILHQKLVSKILGELNPWGYSKSMNIDLYNILEDGNTIDAKKLGFEIYRTPYSLRAEDDSTEADLYISSSGEKYIKPDFGEDVYDEDEYQRDVTFRLYGRVEGSLYINMEDGHISFEHNSISSDYIQVIDKL